MRSASHPVLPGVFAYTATDTSSSVYSALKASSVSYHGNTTVAKGMLASASIYAVLGVQPAIGRLFVAGDDRVEGASPVVVLSYRYWQSRFGGDPGIVGRSIVINRVSFTVIGVTARDFQAIEFGYAPEFTAAALDGRSFENRKPKQ